MQWELSTPVDLEKMAKEEKLCIVPIGVLERHGEHLPLGTDGLVAHKIAVEASKIEPCAVFPVYWFGQVHEAKFSSGAVSFESDFTLALLKNLCDEIARNGFTKIMFVNGHGGNGSLLSYFLFSTMDKNVPYTLYSVMYDSGLTQKYGITPSMSRRGNCYDNAMAENFFSIIKTECIYRHKPVSFKEANEMIDRYIQFYNHERIQLKTGVAPLTLRHSA